MDDSLKDLDKKAIDDSGIMVAVDIADRIVGIDDISPNDWNPNMMDPFMRDRLIRSIQNDGFIIPILVRPDNREGSHSEWEIVDGEQRWSVAKEQLGMTKVPIINLGSISDSDAKQITIKANTLRGEFDSVELGKLIKGLSDDIGIESLSDSLPYTVERLSGLIDLVDTDLSSLNDGLDGLTDGEEEGEDETDSGDGGRDDFQSFDPNAITLEHKCPRCGFEFNDKKDDS